MTKQEKKYYEVGGALIKADSPQEALKIFQGQIDYEEHDVKEVIRDYALCAFSKGLDENGNPVSVRKTLASFYLEESQVMLYPSGL
ncbi:hypothetical protein [Bacillus halotolerans]|uniref:hypothetical protein n=1 Tax=Bacillus halotolerans TaxID=260554 RepID=UPI002DBE6D48|nr:hypothetical protein [Bacillus halotolerans]MEC1647087.1 hypothetical protein [Bacillus halotolerans]